MSKRDCIEAFLKLESIAFFGASRSGKKFGNTAYRELRRKGFRLFPVHPEADLIEGDRSYRTLEEIPERVDGAVVIVAPAQTARIAEALAARGVKSVWMQQGAESREAIEICRRNGVDVIDGECILMFAQPVSSIHRFHRWLWKVMGKLPQ